MKIKLFRIIIPVLALASVINIVSSQPTYADPSPEALKIITECKAKNGPFADDSTCDLYTKCINRVLDTPQCPDIKTYNDMVPGLTSAILQGCRSKNHTNKECTDAFNTCLTNHFKENKLAANDVNACKDAVTKGDLAAATKVPEGKEETKCIITGIGWIVCPVMNFMSMLVDTSYDFVSSLLTVQPLYIEGQGGGNQGSEGTYQAWSIMRNIANVAFVIAFLIIIFSQVTSFGITNYGIKRMLPRLVVAAILVNLSYWICAIAVDISNIIGVSLGGLFNSLKASLADPTLTGFNSGSGWVGITGTILAGVGIAAAIAYIGLSALLPILVAALLAIVTVFLVLTLRQALIILLIVVSPLAFVAYLLPNTEQYFKKWRELFQTLLLMYPIIALIFGTSALASQIVMASAPNTDYKIAVQVMGAGIAIIPLFITPIVMKTAGGLLNRFGGIVNNPNKGPFDRMRKGAEGYRKNRQMFRDVNAMTPGKYRFGQSFVKRGARRRAVIGSREAMLKDANTQYIAGEAGFNGGNNKFAEQMAGGGPLHSADQRRQAAVVAGALAQGEKAFQEDVSNMEALVKVRYDDPQKALEEALASGDATMAVAAQNILFKSGSGGVSRFRNAMESSEAAASQTEDGQAVIAALRKNVRDVQGKYAKEKGADVVNWANSADQSQLLESTAAPKLSDSELAGQHSGSMQKFADNGQISKDQAKRMLEDPRVSASMDDSKKHILAGIADHEFRSTERPPDNELKIAHEEAARINEQKKQAQEEAYDSYHNNIQ